MKQTSYIVLGPAIQDRFWSNQLPAPAADDRVAMDRPPVKITDGSINRRKKIPFDVLVDYSLTYSVPWHIVELGMNSALVRMDSVGLREGEPLEFTLRFKLHRQSHEFRIPAIIERINTHDVLLRFGDYEQDTAESLVALLYSL